MTVFSLDCSAVCASTAIVKDGKVLHSNFKNTGLTHSETLMPMCAQCFEKSGLKPSDIDKFAVNVGPGSFTGVRIGVATVKGLAFKGDRECVPVSTLHSMAYNISEDAIVLATMDARRNQIYTATFDVSGGTVTRLTDDEAVEIDSIAQRISSYDKPVIIVGDGAFVTYEGLRSKCGNVKLADEDKIYQNAVSTAKTVFAENLSSVSASQIMPTYIRLPQAVRELKKKRG